MLTVSAFPFAGISIKLFDFFNSYFGVKSAREEEWKFRPATMNAVFYIILTFIIALSDGMDTISLSVIVLYVLFLCIYAYIGFKLVYSALSARVGSTFALLISVFSILFMWNAILQIISYIGAVSSILSNRKISKPQKD